MNAVADVTGIQNIRKGETESASNIDALYNNICCAPFMKY